jgi:hypothetical protein
MTAGKAERFEPDPSLPGHGLRCHRLKRGEIYMRRGTPPKCLANGQQRRGEFGNAFTVPVEAARKGGQPHPSHVTGTRHPMKGGRFVCAQRASLKIAAVGVTLP